MPFVGLFQSLQSAANYTVRPAMPGAVVADLIDIDVEDVPALVAFACDNQIDLVVVGPEAP